MSKFILIKYFLVVGINIYKKYFSPFMFFRCKFYPTCSQYSKQAILKFGVVKGVFLSVKRLLKCNPFFHGGYDPVP